MYKNGYQKWPFSFFNMVYPQKSTIFGDNFTTKKYEYRED